MQRLDYMDKIADSFLADIFITYREKQYAEEINEKLSSLASLHDNAEQLITPHLLNFSMYKLHICIAYQSYSTNLDNILNILIKYLDPENIACIKEFKFLDINTALAQIELKKELLDYYREYKRHLPNEIGKFNLIAFKKKLATFLGVADWKSLRGKQLPNKTNIDDAINELEICLATQERFLNGDQFTIYLPKNFCKEKILKLCKEINNFLISNQAMEGSHSDVVARVGRYISIRKEYSSVDYDEMERSGVVVPAKRIDAIQEIFTEQEKLRRIAIREEIISSELYRYLNNNLELRGHSAAFYQPTQLIGKEMQQITTVELTNKTK